MPEISRFLGMIIRMYYDDHAPPHFHVRYGEHEAVISILDLACLTGRLPPKAMGLVIEWASAHRAELEEDWALACQDLPLKAILPLE